MPKKSSDTMEYVYAALMLHKLKKDINEDNITNLVKASGAEVNQAQVKALVASLADVDIEEAIKAAPVAVAAAPAASGEAAAGGEKKEGKKEKAEDSGKSEEQAMEGLSALFG
jgi:large subunit ribosomal protein L12